MERIRDILLDMQQGSKPTKNFKNPAERQLFKELTAQGWYVTKRGWPDFACYKGDSLVLVEVKPAGGYHLKKDQYRLLSALARFGIKCFMWTPDHGFEVVTPTSYRLASRRGG